MKPIKKEEDYLQIVIDFNKADLTTAGENQEKKKVFYMELLIYRLKM